jgi:hypothetical protein
MANIKALKHLRRMIQNIPKKNINWSAFITRWDDEDWTKCVLCPGAWIASDPFLNKGCLELENAGQMLYSKLGKTLNETFQEMFDISYNDASRLFFPGCNASDNPKEHKAQFLEILSEVIDEEVYG